MKIYRRMVPRIAKDILRSLLSSDAIELMDGKRDDAELDIAAVFVGYLNTVEKLGEDTRNALERNGLGNEHFSRVKSTIAAKRKIVLGDEATDYIINAVIAALYDSKYVDEIFFDDNELRQAISGALGKYLGVDEELDREVRGRLRNLREGTPEWEIEYQSLIQRMRGHHIGA